MSGWGVRNKRLEETLRRLYGDKDFEFTTQQATDAYLVYNRKDGDIGWCGMSARNALCAAVQQNVLTRVRRGVYKFTKEN